MSLRIISVLMKGELLHINAFSSNLPAISTFHKYMLGSYNLPKKAKGLKANFKPFGLLTFYFRYLSFFIASASLSRPFSMLAIEVA
jgi:hypothetical protein